MQGTRTRIAPRRRLVRDLARATAMTTSLGAIAAVVLLTSCKRTKTAVTVERLGLGSVEVRDATGGRPGGARLNSEAIAKLIRSTMLTSGLVDDAKGDAGPVVPAPGGPSSKSPAGVLRVKADIGTEFAEVDDRGIARAGVSIKFDTRPSDAAGAIDEDVSAGGEQPYQASPSTNRDVLAQQLIERTVTDLLRGFVDRRHLATATPAQIHAEIVADGGRAGMREEAIRAVGARGLRSEVPLLLPLLQHDNEATRDAALGALIALRERRAVTELTRNRSLRDRHEMRKVLEAVAMIGGDEARDYLSFVAESHDDEEIRKLAADAKTRLDRRQAPQRP